MGATGFGNNTSIVFHISEYPAPCLPHIVTKNCLKILKAT